MTTLGSTFWQLALTAPSEVAVNLGQPMEQTAAVQMLLVLTALTMAPAILMTTTSFVRIAVVLTFLRSALGTQNTPPQQVLLGLALFLTLAIMSPVATQLYADGLGPYLDGQKPLAQAYADGVAPLRDFMLHQTRHEDLELFYGVTKLPYPEGPSDVSMRALVPAFVISELRTAFEMGFMLYVPFLIIDLVVASVLMAMGMVMLPPALISLPVKVVLFVLADGWNALVGSLIRSFA